MKYSEIGEPLPKWLFKIVREGESYPRGYYFAWRDFGRGEKIAMPIPLNFVANWCRTAHHWIFRNLVWRQTSLDKLIRIAKNHNEEARQVFQPVIDCPITPEDAARMLRALGRLASLGVEIEPIMRSIEKMGDRPE